jgi:DNA-directed RNA polymerase alpha subunit
MKKLIIEITENDYNIKSNVSMSAHEIIGILEYVKNMILFHENEVSKISKTAKEDRITVLDWAKKTDMSARLFNTITNKNVPEHDRNKFPEYLDELKSMRKERFLKVRNAGKKSWYELEEILIK